MITRAGINTFRIPGMVLRVCIPIELEFSNQDNNHVCVFVSVTREIPAKSARDVYLIRNQWCSDFFTCVCV